MARSSMPSKKEILKYWDNTLDSSERIHGWNIAHSDVCLDGKCMACGSWLQTQRAHILARTEGGSNESDNLHILCANCHHESEMKSGEEYWDWFGVKLLSDSYLTIRLKEQLLANTVT